VLGHNGNLVNAEELRRDLYRADRRHVNTGSDSEILLNVLAHEITHASEGRERLDPDMIFKAVAGVHRPVKGAHAVVAMVPGPGRPGATHPFRATGNSAPQVQWAMY